MIPIDLGPPTPIGADIIPVPHHFSPVKVAEPYRGTGKPEDTLYKYTAVVSLDGTLKHEWPVHINEVALKRHTGGYTSVAYTSDDIAECDQSSIKIYNQNKNVRRVATSPLMQIHDRLKEQMKERGEVPQEEKWISRKALRRAKGGFENTKDIGLCIRTLCSVFNDLGCVPAHVHHCLSTDEKFVFSIFLWYDGHLYRASLSTDERSDTSPVSIYAINHKTSGHNEHMVTLYQWGANTVAAHDDNLLGKFSRCKGNAHNHLPAVLRARAVWRSMHEKGELQRANEREQVHPNNRLSNMDRAHLFNRRNFLCEVVRCVELGLRNADLRMLDGIFMRSSEVAHSGTMMCIVFNFRLRGNGKWLGLHKVARKYYSPRMVVTLRHPEVTFGSYHSSQLGLMVPYDDTMPIDSLVRRIMQLIMECEASMHENALPEELLEDGESWLN